MTTPAYHYIDRILTRFPVPARPFFEVEDLGPVTRVCTGRSIRNKVYLTSNAWIVGDTLVDTGVSDCGDLLVALCEARGVKRALVTHHHEDHSGNALRLQRAGIRVAANPTCVEIIRRGIPIKPYQHIVWGSAPPVVLEKHADTVRIGGYEAKVLAAPGHAVDQVVYWVPEQGWLFGADTFVSEKIRVYRQDEDFGLACRTLAGLSRLDFETLFGGHSYIRSEGPLAYAEKLEKHLELRELALRWHREGLSWEEMTRRSNAGKPKKLLQRIARDDVSFGNLARSAIHGPIVRHELKNVGVPSVSTVPWASDITTPERRRATLRVVHDGELSTTL